MTISGSHTIIATCEARTGVRTDADWPNAPLWCGATLGLTTWTDIDGRTHRACRHHLAAMLRRSPRYVSERYDDPLGQAKAAREAREDAFENGRLTFEWHGHAVDLDVAE